MATSVRTSQTGTTPIFRYALLTVLGREVLDFWRIDHRYCVLSMLLIRYRDGSIREGVLIAIEGEQLRFAVRGGDDVMVFRLLQEGWTSEKGDLVSFEFPNAVFEAIGMVPTLHNTVEDGPVQEQWAWHTAPLLN